MNGAPDSRGEAAAPRAMSLLSALGWAIATVLVPMIPASIAQSIQGDARPDVLSATLGLLFGYTIVVFAILRLYTPTSSLRDVLGVRDVSPLVVLLAIVVGVAIVPALAPVDAFIGAHFPAPDDEQEAVTRLFSATTVGARVRIGVGVVLLMPIGQELFFRGMLFGRLRAGKSALFAVLATSLCEVAARLDLRALPSTLVPALAFALLRAQSGSVVPAVAGQIAYTFAVFAPILAGLSPEEDVAVPLGWSVAGCAALALGLLATWWLTTKSARAAVARLADGPFA